MSKSGPPAHVEPEVASLFDAGWYLATNPDVRQSGLEPLAHWLDFGWREARKPNPHFDTAWYLASYPDIGASGLNPLWHYVRHGDREGRRPAAHFDPVWYRDVYAIPAEQLALRHFLSVRTTGLFAPSPELYAVLHLPRYREELSEGRDPFARALEDASVERREPCVDALIVASSGLLDANFYLIHGTDVHDAELDPARHFCQFGWHEHRKPNIYFDTAWYLRTNPAIARLQINPLVHYILEGEENGRRPVIYFDPKWYRDAYSVSPGQSALAHYLAHRRNQTHSPNPMFDAAWYVRRLGSQIGSNRDPFAHYLQIGTVRDIDPSPNFNAGEYRRRHLGRPSRLFPHNVTPERHNPLVHYLQCGYR